MVNVFETVLGKDEKPAEGSTQEHLPIQTIHDDVVILKDGSAAIVLQTSAVNFDLLSENEQLAIISSFAGMINSLSFAIQIVVRSKRLDVTDYLEHINQVEQKQTNPLLKEMMKRYRTFVETLTQQNEVLDKQFYVVVPISYMEIGLMADIEKNFQKAITLLSPRKDHIIKQLARIGLKAEQLNSARLVTLFHDIYNEAYQEQDIRAFIDQKIASEKTMEQVKAELPKPPPVPDHNKTPQPAPEKKVEAPAKEKQPDVITPVLPPPPATRTVMPEAQIPSAPPAQPVKTTAAQTMDPNNPVFEPYYLETRVPHPEMPNQEMPVENLFSDQKTARPTIPFVVEELLDEYGAAT